MTTQRSDANLKGVLHELRQLPAETEWVEFKHNKALPVDIGEYISGLSNSAALEGQVSAWMVWGVEDGNHDILGTGFKPSLTKVGEEELENWLLRSLSPKIDFRFHSFIDDDKPIVALEIAAAYKHPVQFQGIEYIRVGSYKKKLKDFPDKEKALWRVFDNTPFEREIAAEDVAIDEVLRLLDYPAYFDLLGLNLPDGKTAIVEALEADDMVVRNDAGRWNITNLGAVLFAKQLSDFPHLRRKATRVIQYDGRNKIKTLKEQLGNKGYAVGFEGLVRYINSLLPSNEVIGEALRKTVPMFPELAIRELVANAMIHQDFHLRGTGLTIELYDDRLEITNPGKPLVDVDRLLNSPPKSRNEALASFMRRIGVCEERGSGVDKVVFETELYQLPAPLFEAGEEYTQAVLFAHKSLNEMDKADRVRACYLHACLKVAERDYMTNASLRKRFGVEGKNSATVSRFIKEAVADGAVQPYDEDASRKYMKYVPFWAKA